MTRPVDHVTAMEYEIKKTEITKFYFCEARGCARQRGRLWKTIGLPAFLNPGMKIGLFAGQTSLKADARTLR